MKYFAHVQNKSFAFFIFCGSAAKKNRSKRIFQSFLAAFFLLVSSSLSGREITTSCVAYHTQKDTLFSSQVAVSGKTCQIENLRESRGGRVSYEIRFQAKNLDSGNGRRDKEVALLLGETVRYTVEMTQKQITALPVNGEFDLNGIIFLKSGSYPLTFRVSRSGNSLRGKTVTTFTALGMVPPRVGPAGSIADTADYLELTFEAELNQGISEKAGVQSIFCGASRKK